MVVTWFFHWWFGFFPVESKECPVGVPWLYVVCEQAKPSSFAGTALWRGQWGWSGGAGWWFPLEGSKMTGATEEQMGSLDSIAAASVSCFWRSSLLLLSCIYPQEHSIMWVPYVGCPLKSSLSLLLLFLKDFFKENACLNCTIEVEEVPRTTMQRWWFTRKKVWA